MSFYRLAGKRVCDLVLLAAVAPVALPIAILVSCSIRLCLGSSVLFSQTRVGLHDRPFSLLKFRTMRPPPGGDLRALPDAERLSSFGKWLRSTSLDELPQLWNVARGDLSLVGPRPLLDIYLPRYTPEQRKRHLVPAGITGWAQVSGRNALSWEDKFECDLWYVRNQSFLLDLRILFLTFKPVIMSRNVAGPGQVSCKEFIGGGTNESVR